jgi:hypothetical protein
MKDLYKRLGIPPTADEKAIEAAISRRSIGDDIRRAAREILLVPTRRKQYDTLRSTLVSISELRAGLGLLGTPFSREYDYSDFVAEVRQPESRPDEPQYRPSSATAQEAWQSGSRKRARVVLGGLLILAGALVWPLVKDVRSNRGTTFIPPAADSRPADRSNIEDSGSEAGLLDPNDLTPIPAPFVEPALPYPRTGVIYHVSPKLKVGAPFEVATAAGGAYFLKVLSADTGEEAFTAFVSGGDRIQTILPVGNYILHYAHGDVWYGFEHLFGPSTTYSKADSTFTLTRTRNGYEGVSVELILQELGNLQTESIPASEF